MSMTDNLLTDNVGDIARQLIRSMERYSTVLVAFSGGVDSAVVAAAAFQAIGDRAVAATGVGVAVPESELEIASNIAAAIGIRYVTITTDEIEDPNYTRNDGRRCYFCKSTLYSAMTRWANEHGIETVMSGTNLDDLGDYRPGLQAASEHSVVAPLVDLKINKAMVRSLAQWFGLTIANKPASPCLASRIAYGQSVTVERIRKVEQAEKFLNDLGFEDVRARHHADEILRLELKPEDIQRACEPSVRAMIHRHMSGLGFTFVTIDLMGRQSGSLNRLLPILQ